MPLVLPAPYATYPTPKPVYSSFTQWHIDAQNGNDGNPGNLRSLALQTNAEYIRRTGYEEVFTNGRSVDVFCYGTFPDSDPFLKRAIGVGASYHYGVHGSLAPLLSTNLTSFSASVPATNTRASFSVAAGLTSDMVGALCFFPASGVYSIITTVNVGAQSATCLDPTDAPNVSLGPIPTRHTPTNTEAIIISRGTSVPTLLVEWVSTSVGPAGGPGFVPQRFLLENFAPRGSSSLQKHSGNDYIIDPVIQFCQFQDVDHVVSGSSFWRHNSIQVNGETTIRSRFDATSGPYFVTGNVILSAPGVPFPNCQLGGVEFGTYGTTGVNELSGNCNYQISEFAGYLGRLGLWPTPGGIGRVFFIDGSPNLSSAEIFGSTADAVLLQLGHNVRMTYSASGHVYAVGASSQLSFVRGTGANAAPKPGGALSACTSIADVQAAPFNGRAYDDASNSSIVLV